MRTFIKTTLTLFLCFSIFSCTTNELPTIHAEDNSDVNFLFKPTLNEVQQEFKILRSKNEYKYNFDIIPIWDLSNYGNSKSDNFLISPVYLNIQDNGQIFSTLISRKNINGKIESIITSKIPDYSTESDLYSGKIFFHDLRGKYLAGYKLEDGEIVSEYLERTRSSNKSNDSDCTSPGCQLGEGEEVTVYGSQSSQSNYITSWINPENTIEAPEGFRGGGSVLPCTNNFIFRDVTTNSLWQESQLNNFTQKLVASSLLPSGATTSVINIPHITFGMPYLNIDGNVVFTKHQARDQAAYALYTALWDLRRYFSKNTGYSSYHYENYFKTQLKKAFSALTSGLGRINFINSSSIHVNANAINYDPC